MKKLVILLVVASVMNLNTAYAQEKRSAFEKFKALPGELVEGASIESQKLKGKAVKQMDEVTEKVKRKLDDKVDQTFEALRKPIEKKLIASNKVILQFMKDQLETNLFHVLYNFMYDEIRKEVKESIHKELEDSKREFKKAIGIN